MNELTESPSYEAPAVIDRASFAELLDEPGMSALDVRLVDQENQPRTDIGIIRNARLMSPKQALDRMMSLIRSALANYVGAAIVGVSALDDDGRILRVMTFTATGHGAPSFESGNRGEPMTSGDAFSSLVHQNEFLLRVVVSSQANLMHENQELRRERRDMERERFQFARDREDFLSQKLDRELASKMAEAEIDNRRQMKERILTLAQLAYNKVKGTEMIRMAQTPFEVASYHALQTLSPKLDALVDSGTLTPQDKLTVSTWLEVAMKSLMVTPEQKAEAEKRMQAMTGGTMADDPLARAPSPAAPLSPPSAGNLIGDILGSLGVQLGGQR